MGERSSATEPDPKGGEADRSGTFGRRERAPEEDGDRRHPDEGPGLRLGPQRIGELGDARARTPTHEDMNMKGTFRCAWQSKTKKIDP